MKIACITPRVVVADPMANADLILDEIKKTDASIILTPELSLSSYSAMKLFHQKSLIDACEEALSYLTRSIDNQFVVVGMPVPLENALYNCAVVINRNKVIGVVPKEFVPNYNEFEEGQWFSPARAEDLPETIRILGKDVPFGTRLIFSDDHNCQANIFIEVCEAIWMTIPPSSFGCIAGANIVLNPSASTETVGKQDLRRCHVISQSGRCVAAYAYCSCGPTESTNDVVFGGHSLIAECGSLIIESDRIGNNVNRESYHIESIVDLEKIGNDRRTQTSYAESEKFIRGIKFTRVPFNVLQKHYYRKASPYPFVPTDGKSLDQRCAEIFDIQTCALAKRIETIPNKKVSIGVSGGLDSTLALLITCETFKMLGLPASSIHAITMPGFGTTSATFNNAKKLMSLSGVTSSEIDIRSACFEEFKVLNGINGYKPFDIDISNMSLDDFNFILNEVESFEDLTFENVQARRRTEYLMNLGFVIGTGDMSELFQGWCTYNADQQSMYNVNCSIPKTLVKFLVSYIAKREKDSLRQVLTDIVNTEISPELLPTAAKQSTESKIGPYALIDFLMYHLIRNGFSTQRIFDMSNDAFPEIPKEERKKWMKIHLKRFFNQQFKRENVPNGPKVGSVSLSPRSGNWRMPCEASPNAWIKEW